MSTKRNIILTSACIVAMGGLLQTQAMAVEADFTGASVMLSAPACGEAHLRVSGDSGETNSSFDSCADLSFSAVDDAGQPLADGIYHYELTVVPEGLAQDQEALIAAQEENDEAAAAEIATRLQDYEVATESGIFHVSGGAAGAYDESVIEAEAQAETDAEQAVAEQPVTEGPMPGID